MPTSMSRRAPGLDLTSLCSCRHGVFLLQFFGLPVICDSSCAACNACAASWASLTFPACVPRVSCSLGCTAQVKAQLRRGNAELARATLAKEGLLGELRNQIAIIRCAALARCFPFCTFWLLQAARACPGRERCQHGSTESRPFAYRRRAALENT